MAEWESGGNVQINNKKGRYIRHELPKTWYLSEETEITGKLVGQLIEDHIENNVPRYKQLQKYYEGWAAILERSKKSHKANNHIISGYPSYIVDVLLGMFVGNPVDYTVPDDKQKVMDDVQEVFDNNDEQDENTEIAKMCGIKGRGYEIVYQDENSDTRFNELHPENVVYVYDDKINPSPLFAIYFHEIVDPSDIFSNDKEMRATVYAREEVYTYESSEGKYVRVKEEGNLFNEVQIVEFLNNDEGIGDFELVLSYVDAYNMSLSDTANDFEEFTDALLILYGMLMADEDDVQEMLEDAVLLLDREGGSQGAEWLIKQINDAALQNYNNRLDNDIHKFAKVPNIGDENFAGNNSGEAMKYKLLAMDQVISSKQRKFKTGLQSRLRLILTILSIRGNGQFSFRDIEIKFNSNKPVNEKEAVEMALQYAKLGSKTTALTMVPRINVNDELERIEQEESAYRSMDEAAKLLTDSLKEEDDLDEEPL